MVITTMMQMPVCLTKNVLLQERLTANPQYWTSGATSTIDLDPPDQLKSFVLIRPECIELKQEIGEGCFGKVYRGSKSIKTELIDTYTVL